VTAAAPEAGPDFDELDAELGRALKDRGLVWDDLAAAAKEPARRWARWYKKTEAPSAHDLATTYAQLLKAVDTAARAKGRAAESADVPADESDDN
jgi:hypothetical protein